jgi:hypothetical protein
VIRNSVIKNLLLGNFVPASSGGNRTDAYTAYIIIFAIFEAKIGGNSSRKRKTYFKNVTIPVYIYLRFREAPFLSKKSKSLYPTE